MDITTLDRYQMEALRTAANSTDKDFRMMVVTLGLAGEVGEVADHVKKVQGHGHELDEDHLIEELGDILWYVANLADVLNVSMSEVATRNISKLKARYPEGFSSERSINREDPPEHGV